VEATGKKVPDPINSFDEMELGPVVRNCIALLHYNAPTPVQKYAFPILREGRDLMACAQTGTFRVCCSLFYVNPTQICI